MVCLEEDSGMRDRDVETIQILQKTKNIMTFRFGTHRKSFFGGAAAFPQACVQPCPQCFLKKPLAMRLRL